MSPPVRPGVFLCREKMPTTEYYDRGMPEGCRFLLPAGRWMQEEESAGSYPYLLGLQARGVLTVRQKEAGSRRCA